MTMQSKLLSAVLSSAAGVLCIYYYQQLQQKIKELEELATTQKKEKEVTELALRKEIHLRKQERAGRTTAERVAREKIQSQNEMFGYHMQSIGTVESCYPHRRGTPRQGNLVPSSRAKIRLNKAIPPASVDSLDQYSHLWVIFVFHENTNFAKVQTNQQTMLAKIAPPRLGGKKVGLFSTRTPHRPNAIGLSVVRIESVHERYIEISGHDLVNGTPVLDVKPYVPNDCIPSSICPQWVAENADISQRNVEIKARAMEELNSIIQSNGLAFFSDAKHFIQFMKEILVLDIRSVYQGRGKASDKVFTCHLDTVELSFVTLEKGIEVISFKLSK